MTCAPASAQAVHQCRADRYEITYLVLSEDVMEERWRVRGPDKDYQATATLIRWITDPQTIAACANFIAPWTSTT